MHCQEIRFHWHRLALVGAVTPPGMWASVQKCRLPFLACVISLKVLGLLT